MNSTACPPASLCRARDRSILFIWLQLGFLGLTLRAGQMEETNSALVRFQQFSNGHIPIKEAVVYRRIEESGSSTHESWLRFGFQDKSWFGQWVKPDPQAPDRFLPIDDHITGATRSDFWIISDRNIHLVPIDKASGSTPGTFCEASWSMIRSSVSLCLPMPHDGIGGIRWDGPRFESRSVTAYDEQWVTPLETNIVRATLVLNAAGRPSSIEYNYPRDMRLDSVVTYEYEPDLLDVPRIITHERPNGRLVFRYEFLVLNLGAVDLGETDGYVPSLVADMSLQRTVAVWSHENMWFLRDGELRPGFGFEPYRPPTAYAPWILGAVASVIVMFLVLWLLRSRRLLTKAAKTHNT